jgi:hypothetical protein
MPVLFLLMAKTHDWQAVRTLHVEALLAEARRAGVSAYQVYRSRHDATHLLILVELPDDDALRAWYAECCGQLERLGGGYQIHIWEPTGWERVP